MSSTEHNPQGADSDLPSGVLQFRRVLPVVALLGGLLVVFALGMIFAERRKEQQSKLWEMERFGFANAVAQRLDPRYRDENHDLIADPPPADQCVQPAELKFCYIPGDSNTGDATKWAPFLDQLSQAVGVPVTYFQVDSVAEQVSAMRDGTLHITAFNSGSVPRAVNSAGFVPVSVKADGDGQWEITMKFIVPAKSSIQELESLRGRSVTFTNPSSFSGFRFAIATLYSEFGLKPGTDYSYRFSTSHDESIRHVANGEHEVAVVASDLLDAAIARGELTAEDIRVIYTSTPFPAASFGYAHNLVPELADKLRQFLVDRDLSDTPLVPTDRDGQPVPAGMLAATDYLKDWLAVRKVDESLANPEDFNASPDPTVSNSMEEEESAAETTESNASESDGENEVPREPDADAADAPEADATRG